MISRNEALAFVNEKIVNKNIVKHMRALEACMGGIYDYLANKSIKDLGGTKEEWMMTGLFCDVSTEMVMKKFGNKSFASGTRREDIRLCEEKMGISLPEFIGVCLKAMQNVHGTLGL